MRRPVSATEAPRQREAGITLVELLVYMMLSVVVLTIVGGMLINGIQSENIVRDSTSANATGQLIARSVKQGVSNASDVKATVDAHGNELLVVHTRDSGTALSWSCEAWYFAPGAEGAVYRKRVSPVAHISAPASTAPEHLAGWLLLGTGVKPVSTTLFGVTVSRVDLKFTVDAGTAKPVLFSTVNSQRITSSESTACF